MIAAFRQGLQRGTRLSAERLVSPLARTRLTPNVLTTVGFLLNVVAGAVLGTGALVAGGVLILLASASDMFDGALARVCGRQTRFGAFYDSTLDRFSEAVLLLGLVIAFGRSGDWVGSALCYGVMTGSFLVSYCRARAEGLGLDCEVGWAQRPERVIVLGLATIAAGAVSVEILRAALLLLIVLTHVTVVQRILHVRRLLKFEAERPADGRA